MKFNITTKLLFNELRNYLSLGFTFIAHVVSLPTIICITIADKLKVDY